MTSPIPEPSPVRWKARCWVRPAIAVSLKRTPTFDFQPAAEHAAKLARLVLSQGLPPRTFLNINVPAGKPKGIRVTTQARRNHVTQIDARTDPRGSAYYWIDEALDEYHPDSGRSDYESRHRRLHIGDAVAAGHDRLRVAQGVGE